MECERCKKDGNHHTLCIPASINVWLCMDCRDLWYKKYDEFQEMFLQDTENMPIESDLKDNYWKDIWTEEPPRWEDILFMTGDENIHIGLCYGNEKLRKCAFHSNTEGFDFECDEITELERRVILWHPLPIKKED